MALMFGSVKFRSLRAAILRVLEPLAFVAPLATRIVIGTTYMQTGWGKLHHFPRIVAFFTSLGIPFPTFNAGLVSTLELVGGTFLVLGLGTRAFAAALSCSMTVALLTADRQAFLTAWNPASDTTPTDVASFTFLLFLLWLVFLGPGRASLDHLLVRRARGRGEAPSDVPVTETPSPAYPGPAQHEIASPTRQKGDER
jgi:putative oxidoreductase